MEAVSVSVHGGGDPDQETLAAICEPPLPCTCSKHLPWCGPAGAPASQGCGAVLARQCAVPACVATRTRPAPTPLQVGSVDFDRQGIANHAKNLASNIQVRVCGKAHRRNGLAALPILATARNACACVTGRQGASGAWDVCASAGHAPLCSLALGEHTALSVPSGLALCACRAT